MYGQSGHGVRATTMATDATVTSVLTVAGANRLAVEIQTFANFVAASTANIYVQVCDTATGTFRRLTIGGVYSGGSGILDWEVPSSVGSRYYQLPDEVASYKYCKIQLSNAVTASMAINLHVFH